MGSCLSPDSRRRTEGLPHSWVLLNGLHPEATSGAQGCVSQLSVFPGTSCSLFLKTGMAGPLHTDRHTVFLPYASMYTRFSRDATAVGAGGRLPFCFL